MDLFGNVPFVDESDPIGVFAPEQYTRSELFNWIEAELLSIEDNLLEPASFHMEGQVSSSTNLTS